MNQSENPLITLVLLAYNQENYIKESIEGAFDQSYQPLEIILSDDCSSDSTFQVMIDMTRNYSGPHKILLNKNKSNLGIGAHVNTITNLANGGLVVLNAGDDISLPRRVLEISKVWQKNDFSSMVFHSNVNIIDENSNFIDVLKPKSIPNGMTLTEYISNDIHIIGATQAYTKDLFDFFGELNKKVIAEDIIITLRGFLKGKLHYLNDELVSYRTGGISSSFLNLNKEELRKVSRKSLNMNFDSTLQKLIDLRLIDNDVEICSLLMKTLMRKLNKVQLLEGAIGINKAIFNELFLGGGFKSAFFLLAHHFDFYKHLIKVLRYKKSL